MKLIDYLKDKLIPIFIYIINTFIIAMLLVAFKNNYFLIIIIVILLIILGLILLLTDYLKKRVFYNNIQSKLINLDKKYLVLEMLDKPKNK